MTAPRWSPLAVALALSLASTARADGAFPSESAVFLPASAPKEILLATNFGLLLSQDRGATFAYACENPLISAYGNNVGLYQVSDDGTILADTGAGLFRSTDGACGWQQAGGALANVPVLDAAFDPTLQGFVLALAAPNLDQGTIHASTDDGATFGPPLWSGNANLTGVEFSRSQPGRVYVTGNAACPGIPGGSAFLLRSDDRGATWTTFDLSALGRVVLRIAQVDPTDPDTVYFRLTELGAGGGDLLVWTRDGGRTLEPALRLESAMAAFLRARDGTLYVASTQDELYRLTPGSPRWQRLVGGAHLRCLAESQGTLYGCGDNYRDLMALGASVDHGQSFCPLVQFKQIQGLLGCANVQQQCAAMWTGLSHGLCPGDAGPCPEAIDAGPCLVEDDGGQAIVDLGALPTRDAGPCTLDASTPAGGDGGATDGGEDGGDEAAGGTTDGGPGQVGSRDGGSPLRAGPTSCRGCGQGGESDLAIAFALLAAGARRRVSDA